jgi:hypothetical protein
LSFRLAKEFTSACRNRQNCAQREFVKKLPAL